MDFHTREERTGKNIEDFLDDSCFVKDDDNDDDYDDDEMSSAEWHNWEEYRADIDLLGMVEELNDEHEREEDEK
mgnify:CR=1 FL=1